MISSDIVGLYAGGVYFNHYGDVCKICIAKYVNAQSVVLLVQSGCYFK